MKERMPFTLDFDTLKSEANRAMMRVEQTGCTELDGIEIVMTVSNYTHPVSVAGELLALIRKSLNTDDFLFIRSTETPCDETSTRICAYVLPRRKETLDAS